MGRSIVISSEMKIAIREFVIHCIKEHSRYRWIVKAADGTEEFAGVKIAYCEICRGFWPQRATSWSALAKSIIRCGPLIAESLPKWTEEKLRDFIRNPKRELTARRKTSLIKEVQQKAKAKYGHIPSFTTVDKVLRFCVEAGRKLGVTPNGIVRKIPADGEAYIRTPDPFGIDPPLGFRHFACSNCGRVTDVTDTIENTLFFCRTCGKWWEYGLDIKPARLRPATMPRLLSLAERVFPIISSHPVRTLLSDIREAYWP